MPKTTEQFTVSGPGVDHRTVSAEIALSFAINLGSRAQREHTEATYYVRDADGEMRYRIESKPDLVEIYTR